MTEPQHYAWSDPHFGHKRMAEEWRLGDGFDGTVPGMSQILQERCNAVLRPEDHLWLAGDAVMGIREDNIKWFASLNCDNIHLIPGNHDDNHPMHAKKARYERMCALYAEFFIVEDLVVDGEKFGIPGAIMCHFPWYGTADHVIERDLTKWFPRQEQYPIGTVLVHGHTHSKQRLGRNMIHVGVDAWPEGPVPMEAIAELMPHARAWL